MDQRLRYGGRCPGCHRFVDSLDMSRMGLSPWIINTWIENPILSRKKTASVWRQNSFFLFSPPRPKRDVNKKRNDPTLQLDIVHVYFYMFHTYKILVIYVPCLFLISRNLCNPVVPSGLSLTTVKKWGVELWDVGKGCLSVRPCRWCWPHATSHERFQTPLCQHHRSRATLMRLFGHILD